MEWYIYEVVRCLECHCTNLFISMYEYMYMFRSVCTQFDVHDVLCRYGMTRACSVHFLPKVKERFYSRKAPLH